MNDKTLKSGAVLGIQLADFEDSMSLLEAILNEAVGVSTPGLELENLFKSDISQLKDALFKVIASKRVKDALWKCMSSCTYQPAGESAGLRIDRATTFQSEKTRPDYFPVAGEVTTYNLAPFFKNLELPSSILGAAPAGGSQPSKTG